MLLNNIQGLYTRDHHIVWEQNDVVLVLIDGLSGGWPEAIIKHTVSHCVMIGMKSHSSNVKDRCTCSVILIDSQ